MGKRKTWRSVCLGVVAASAVVCGLAGSASAAAYRLTQETATDINEMVPAVDGDRIVYLADGVAGARDLVLLDGAGVKTVITSGTDLDNAKAKVKGDYVVFNRGNTTTDIYCYTISTGTTVRVTNNYLSNYDAQLEGDAIVWTQGWNLDGATFEIYRYDIPSGVATQVTANACSDGSPRVSGTDIVWRQTCLGSPVQAMHHDIVTGVTTQLSQGAESSYYPAVDRGRVVWTQGTNLMLHDLAAGQTTVAATGDIVAWSTFISGDSVVWLANDGTDYEVFHKNLATGATAQLTNDTVYHESLLLKGHTAVWHTYSDVQNEFYAFDTLAGVTTKVTDEAVATGNQWVTTDGTSVVWSASPLGESDYDVFRARVAPTYQLTQETATDVNEMLPAVDGDRIVYLADGVAGSRDLVLLDGTGVKTVIASVTDIDNVSAKVEGDYVVYNRGTTVTDIYCYTISTGTTVRVTNNYLSNYDAQLEGDAIVWTQGWNLDGATFEIWRYDIPSGVATQVTANACSDGSPRVSGTDIVWRQTCPGSPVRAMHHDLVSGVTTQLSQGTVDSYYPSVDQGRVVWTQGTNLMLHDLVTGQTTVAATGDIVVWSTFISGDSVAWLANDGTDYEVFHKNLATGATAQLTNDTVYQDSFLMKGHTAVWRTYSGAENEFYAFDTLAGVTTKVTDEAVATNNQWVTTDGTSVVWSASPVGESDYDIFRAVAANGAPVAVADAVTTIEDRPIWVEVLANDGDLDLDELSIVDFSQGTYGTVYAEGGRLGYLPPANFFGVDTFSYTISDGRGGSASAFVTVSVTSINDNPVAEAGDDQTGLAGQTLSFSGAASADVDGTIASYAWQWGDGTPDGAGVDATHVYAAAGVFTVTLTVADNLGLVGTDTLTVTVNPVNLALNRTATASSTRKGSSFVAAKAVDGSAATSWMSARTNNAQWVRVDLGSSRSISTIKVLWPAVYYARGFRVETSTNGNSWTQRYVTSAGDGSATTVTFAPASARYVRVSCTTPNNSSFYGVSELEVYQ